MSHKYSANKAIRHFGFHQTLRGALIVGLLAGVLMGAQGAAYAVAYPDQQSREVFVASLKSVPALGFMAGEIRDASTPASYSIYKSMAVMTLLIAVWALMVSTKLLRGQEEDGRLENLLGGKTTKIGVTRNLLIGYGYSFVCAFLIAWLVVAGLGDPNVNLPVGSAGLLAVSVFLPGLFFTGVGALTSQLALTRSRALAYGLVPLLVLFCVRGAANSIASWDDLKRYTPFGWSDLMNPVLDADVRWIVPTLLSVFVLLALALFLAGTRDLGNSIINQTDRVASRFYLLGSAFSFVIRQSISPFAWWMIGIIAYSGLLASIAKVGADALASSPAFAKIIGSLGGSYDDLVVAFLGFGGLFTGIILLVMAAVTLGSVRSQEAKGYLENMLVQPVPRTTWLIKRITIMTAMITTISLLSAYATWQIVSMQGVRLDLGILLQNALGLIGVVIVLIGIGTLFYGFAPRVATPILYATIVWAFVVDVIKSFFSLSDFVDKTSLLHYVTLTPTKTPDWSTFVWLVGVGLIGITIGVIGFAKRDIVTE